jgi:hypothetical protein
VEFESTNFFFNFYFTILFAYVVVVAANGEFSCNPRASPTRIHDGEVHLVAISCYCNYSRHMDTDTEKR